MVQVGISLILYLAISGWLEDQVNNTLRLTGNQVSLLLYNADEPQNPVDLEDVQAQLANDDLATQSFLREKRFFIRLIDQTTGDILGSSADFTLPVTPLPATGEAVFTTLPWSEAAGTGEMQLYSLPLPYESRYVLQVGLSLAETRTLQESIRHLLLLLTLFVLVAAPLSGWFLANRALVPIRAAVRAAAEINETDLSRRMDSAAAEIELEQLVQTFNAMLHRLEQAFQRQRQFTADAAHELRTPLSIIQTGLEVTLSRERQAADYQAALVSIQEEIQRLAHLTDALLLLARTDSRERPLQADPVHFSLLLHTIAEQFDPTAQEKGIRLERAIAPDLWLTGDEGQLIQLVFNLFDNAVKYTPAQGLVRISAAMHESALQLVVEDSGPGIPAAQQAHIFERFYRIDSARNRQQGGFGLGLAIAKRIVERHHGSIQVVSGTGAGSRFVVTLPLNPHLMRPPDHALIDPSSV